MARDSRRVRVWAFLLVRGLEAVAWGLGAGDGLAVAG